MKKTTSIILIVLIIAGIILGVLYASGVFSKWKKESAKEEGKTVDPDTGMNRIPRIDTGALTPAGINQDSKGSPQWHWLDQTEIAGLMVSSGKRSR